MFYAFCHNWSIVLCETKSKLFPARIPNYQAIFRKVWILYKFGFVGKSKLLDFTTNADYYGILLFIFITWHSIDRFMCYNIREVMKMRESRLFRIVYYLLQNGKATAPELAQKFEVSIRTIYRDIDSISSAGIPIYATQGKGGAFYT